ncbi:hypothetical protein C5167_011622 [Papaver somniferum]|uniref:Uncharacterized protein n=1 Tax=Papaver somniferum TaxID=3469 RepID=A0A4Y7K6W3_PAPSO|nr:hypothetical protein C5167_011622 [Papaver somniferum]
MKMAVNNHKSGAILVVLGSLLCLNVCEDLELLLQRKEGTQTITLNQGLVLGRATENESKSRSYNNGAMDSGVVVGAGWQSVIAHVNLACYYLVLVRIPVVMILGYLINKS